MQPAHGWDTNVGLNSSPYKLPIGRRIEAHRKAAGMSRHELAARIGTSPNRQANIENGRTPLHADELVRIADALRLPVGSIVEESMPMT